MIPVVLDANALLLPFSDGTDLEAELHRIVGQHQWILPTCVEEELNTLASGSGATNRHAKMALRLVQDAQRFDSTQPGDDGVLEAARALNGAILSNDRTLQQTARRQGLRVIASRGHGRLDERFR